MPLPQLPVEGWLPVVRVERVRQPLRQRNPGQHIKHWHANTFHIGYIDSAGKPKKFHCKRLSLDPIIFSIGDKKTCHCRWIVTLTGVTVTDGLTWSVSDNFAQLCIINLIDSISIKDVNFTLHIFCRQEHRFAVAFDADFHCSPAWRWETPLSCGRAAYW